MPALISQAYHGRANLRPLMKKLNTPRRKRLSEAARLSLAKKWIMEYPGKNIVKGYARWFGVDWLCALAELKLAGVAFTTEGEKKVVAAYNQRLAIRRSQRQRRALADKEIFESDGHFALIIGYTAGGAPYGVTHDECEEGP
jgi:hypothetical protein